MSTAPQVTRARPRAVPMPSAAAGACRRFVRAGAIGAFLGLGATAVADTIDTAGQPPHERCGYCHEADGNPRMEQFPRLAGQHYAYLAKQLRDYRDGRRKGIMQATAELLNDEDIAAVAAYFSAQTPRPAPAAAAFDLAAAERLYRRGDPERGVAACSGCHGMNGEGRDLIPRVAGQHAAYLETQLLAFKRGERANDPEGAMRQVVARLEEKELRALAGYLARMR